MTVAWDDVVHTPNQETAISVKYYLWLRGLIIKCLCLYRKLSNFSLVSLLNCHSHTSPKRRGQPVGPVPLRDYVGSVASDSPASGTIPHFWQHEAGATHLYYSCKASPRAPDKAATFSWVCNYCITSCFKYSRALFRRILLP